MGKEFFLFLAPLPLIILASRYPFFSLVVKFALGLILYRFNGQNMALGFMLGVALFSWTMGTLIHYSFPTLKVIIISLILGAAGASLFFLTLGRDYITQSGEVFQRAMVDSLTYYKGQGLSEEKAALLGESLKTVINILAKDLPSLIIIMAALFILGHYFLARVFLKKMGQALPDLKPPVFWKIPYAVIWFFIAAGFSLWLGRIKGLDLFNRLGLNLMTLILSLYLGQGFILLYFFLKKWHWPVAMQIILYLLLLFQPVFLFFLILWGIFEVWFDFRKLEAKESKL